MVAFHVNTGWEAVDKRARDKGDVISPSELRDLKIYPANELRCPQYMPDIPREAFLDAEFNFRASRWKTSSQLYLQALEMACVILANEGAAEKAFKDSMSKKPLTKRINELFEAGKITSDMKEWAHQIRVIGQFDKHAYIEAQEVDARELRSFSELFMQYAFSMPGMLADRKMRIKEARSSE